MRKKVNWIIVFFILIVFSTYGNFNTVPIDNELINKIPIGIGIVEDRIFVEVNDFFLQLVGYSREEIIGERTRVLYDSMEEYDSIGKKYYSQIDNLGFAKVESRFIKKDGSYLYVILSSIPHSREGNSNRVLFTVYDITKRVEAEKQVQESEERFRTLFFDHAAVMMLIDPNTGVIKYANKSAHKYYKWPGESLVGKYIDDINLLSKEEIETEMLKAKSQNRTLFEFRHLRGDGSIRNVEVYSSGIKFGEETLLFSLIHDITEKKELGRQNNFRLKLILFGLLVLVILLSGLISVLVISISRKKRGEEALLLAKNQAEEATRAKSEFLATMSHEIRTPLNGIIGFSQILSEADLSPSSVKYAEYIKNSSLTLLGLVNDILDFSKIESGKMEFDFVAVEIRELLSETVSMVSFQAFEKGLNIDLVVDSDIPEYIVTEPLRLRQVLLNLLGNSIKFTHKGYIKLKVSKSLNKILFQIEDTGIGIKEENIDKLFESFKQVDGSITRRFGGSGLGLFISNSLAKVLGSPITVKSEFGNGSVFSFTLEIKEPDRPLKKIEQNESNLEEEIIDNFDPKIIIAEDNNTNMELICHVVKSFMPRSIILRATNGVEAVELFNNWNPDLILMDVNMPELDGLSATKQIRNIEYGSIIFNKDIPIIALSAGVTEEERGLAIESGMTGFLGKPIHPGEIIKALKKFLLDREQYLIFDKDDFNSRILGNKKLGEKILIKFIENTKEDLEEIASNNLEKQKIKDIIHRLKGSSGNVSAISLTNYILYIEKCIKSEIQIENIDQKLHYNFRNFEQYIVESGYISSN